MQKVLIIGAGKCGLKIMLETDTLEVFAVVDRNEHALPWL
jgi:NADH dehydrogenase FAD-containing subunit